MATFTIDIDNQTAREKIQEVEDDFAKVAKGASDVSKETKSFEEWLSKSAESSESLSAGLEGTAATTSKTSANMASAAAKASVLSKSSVNFLSKATAQADLLSSSLDKLKQGDIGGALTGVAQSGVFASLTKTVVGVVLLASKLNSVYHLMQFARKKYQPLDKALLSFETRVKRVINSNDKLRRAVDFSSNSFRKMSHHVKASAKGAGLDTDVLSKKANALADNTIKATGAVVAFSGALGKAAMMAQKLLSVLWKFLIPIAAIVAAWKLLRFAIDATFKSMHNIQRQNIFGVQAKQVADFKGELGGVLTLAESAKEVMDFRRIGFQDEQIQKAATLSKVISKLTGQSEKTTLAMLRSGEVSSSVLRTLRIPQAELSLAFAKAKKDIGRVLEPMEKARVAIDLLSRKTKGYGPLVKKAFPVNPFQKFAAEFRSVWQEVSYFFSHDISDLVVGAAKLIAGALRLILVPIKAIGRGINWLMKAIGLISETSKKQADSAKAAEELRKKLAAQEKAWKGNATAARSAMSALDDSDSKMSKTEKKLLDMMSRMKEAFATFNSTLRSALTAQREVFEKISSVSKKHGDAVAAGIRLSYEQLIRLRMQGKLTRQEFLMALKVQTKLDDARARIKSANIQVQNGISLQRNRLLLASDEVKSLEISNKIREENRKADENLLRISKLQLVVGLQRNQVKEKMRTASDKQRRILLSQLFLLREQEHSLLSAGKSIKLQMKNRVDVLKIQRDYQNIQNKISSDKRQKDNLRGMYEITKATGEVNKEILKIQGRYSTAQAIIAANSEKINAVENKRLAVVARMNQIDMILGKNLAKGQRYHNLMAEVAALDDQRKALEEQEKRINSLTKAQLKQISVIGGAIESAKSQVSDLSAKVGQQLFQSFQNVSAGLGQIVASVFENAITGADDLGAVVGKGFLQALAGMAMQLGAFFIAAGTAQMFVPPYSGAGAIAGGLALMALGGALKGMTSLIGSTATAPTVSAGTGTSPVSTGIETTSVPTTAQGVESKQDVNIYVNQYTHPWNKRTPEEDWDSWQDWGAEMARRTGKKMGGRMVEGAVI